MTGPASRGDWTPKRMAELERLWRAGTTAAAIARALGVSKGAVAGKLGRMALPARPSPIQRGAPPRPHAPPAPAATLPPPPLQPAAAPAGRPPSAVPQPRPFPAVRDCCWPLGDPGTPSFRFCGAPAAPGKPYCAGHVALAYVPVRPLREAGNG